MDSERLGQHWIPSYPVVVWSRVIWAYLARIRKRETAVCPHCNNDEVDSPEHTFFQCFAWDRERLELTSEIGVVRSFNEVVSRMLEEQTNWNAAERCARNIIIAKEAAERARERGIDSLLLDPP